MNKRGSEELVKAIVGLALAAIIVWSLFAGISRLSQIILSSQANKEILNGDFTNLIKQIGNVIQTKKTQVFELIMPYDELIFALNTDLKFKEYVTYVNPSTKEKINFDLIRKPSNCNKAACICKCKLTDSQLIVAEEGKELQCKDNLANCFVLDEAYKFKTQLLIKQGECIELKEQGQINDYILNRDGQFEIPMEINMESLEVNILCLNKYK